MKTKLEYVWLDGYEPEPNLRSKIKIIYGGISDITQVPEWNFDGSSTQQAEGSSSDCILKPVRLYREIGQNSKIYVLCEVMKPDGTPHETNQRAKLGEEDGGLWFGFEQEYFIREGRNKPVLGHNNGFIEGQGKYYCGVGVNVIGRDIVEEHMDLCLSMGINITGVNAEVALGQWEYQVFGEGKIRACDDLWMSRYLMEKLSEKYNYWIDYHPKPIRTGEWNGSGLHTNFSTEKMRNEGGETYFQSLFSALESRRDVHMQNYGSDNEMRLTGKFETQSIDKFSWGVSDRGASIRVPQSTAKNWKGYIEDRRPASNANPYNIVKVISDTIDMADELNEIKSIMFSNVNVKNFDIIREKYKGIPSSRELLEEYRNDDDYELSNEFMESKSNIEPGQQPEINVNKTTFDSLPEALKRAMMNADNVEINPIEK
jgi:glutamine synthetase